MAWWCVRRSFWQAFWLTVRLLPWGSKDIAHPISRPLLGAVGEELAHLWLWWHGATPIARNWKGRKGELDLIYFWRGGLYAVEVKTRRRVGEEVSLPSSSRFRKSQEVAMERTFQEFRKNLAHHGRLRFLAVVPYYYDGIEVTLLHNRWWPWQITYLHDIIEEQEKR